MGIVLLYKSSGYDAGQSPRNSMDIDSLEGQIMGEEAFSSSITEEGFEKVDFRNLRAKYAKGAPEDASTGNSTRDGRGEFIAEDAEGKSRKSYGTNFNPAVNFSGKGRSFLKLKAAIACLALKKITNDFIGQISEYIKFFRSKRSPGDKQMIMFPIDNAYRGPGPHPLGIHRQFKFLLKLDMFKKNSSSKYRLSLSCMF